MTPTADQSAAFLAQKLRAREPFGYFRFGDGFLELVAGKQGGTRDRERYSPWLAKELREAWDALLQMPNLYLGDWRSASFIGSTEHTRYTEQYEALVGDHTPGFLHFEALLLMRQSRELRDFYEAVRTDTRRKLFLGHFREAANFLRADHLPCSWANGLQQQELRIIEGELERRQWDVLLYGAGMAGTIPVVKAWAKHPERTVINTGSALDPIAGRKTRQQQLAPEIARSVFREVVA